MDIDDQRFSQRCRLFLELLVIQNGGLDGIVFPQRDDVGATGCDDLPHFVYFVLPAGSVQFQQGLPPGSGPDDDVRRPEGRLIGSEGHAGRPPIQTLAHRQPLAQDGLHLPQRTQSHLELLDLVCPSALGVVGSVARRPRRGRACRRGGQEVEYEVYDAHQIEMNDCAPGERIPLEGGGGEMKLEVF